MIRSLHFDAEPLTFITALVNQILKLFPLHKRLTILLDSLPRPVPSSAGAAAVCRQRPGARGGVCARLPDFGVRPAARGEARAQTAGAGAGHIHLRHRARRRVRGEGGGGHAERAISGHVGMSWLFSSNTSFRYSVFNLVIVNVI